MNVFFTQLKTIARTIRLSADEKQRMRFALLNYIEQNPMQVTPVASSVPHKVPSPYYWYSPRFAMPLAVVLIVGLSSGTAFAAQSALPGNPLYAVKINVNEPIQTALATTPEAKAQVNAQIATTRLVEAETLAANGKLDASTSQELANNFTAHASAAVANANDLSENDPGTAVELGAKFSSTLAAHSAILAQIGDDTKGSMSGDNSQALALAINAEQYDEDTDTDNTDGPAVTTLALATDTAEATSAEATATPMMAVAPAAKVSTFAAKTNDVHVATVTTATVTPSVAPQSNPEDAKGAARDKAIATSLQTQASTNIVTVVHNFAGIQTQLDAATAAKVQAQIANAQSVFAQGSASLAAGNLSAAKSQFNTVVRMTVKLDTYLTVGKKINIKLLSSLLGVSTTVKTSGSSKDTGSNSNSDKGTPSASTTPASSTNSQSNSGSSTNSNDGSSKGSDDSNNIELHL